MATFSTVTRQHVLAAIAECRDRGAEAFLAVHGFAGYPGDTLMVDGEAFNAQAILAVAHKHATGRAATPEEFGDPNIAVTILRRRDFEVTRAPGTGRAGAAAKVAAAAGPRATRPGGSHGASGKGRAAVKPVAKSPAAAARRRAEVEPTICPSCSMSLPATGICDNCG